jgi:hypothetical protein
MKNNGSTMPSAKSRSGTKWTEAQYQQAGWHQLKLRLPLDAIEALKAAAVERDVSCSKLVDEWIREKLKS